MATDVIPPAHDLAILARLLLPEGEELASAARGLLLIRFDQADLDRIHQLNLVNQAGQLSLAERAELDEYCRASFLLDLIHSKARRALKATRETG